MITVLMSNQSLRNYIIIYLVLLTNIIRTPRVIWTKEPLNGSLALQETGRVFLLLTFLRLVF